MSVREFRGWKIAAPFLWLFASLVVQAQDTSKASPEKAKTAPPKRGLQINDSRALQGYTVLAPMMSNKTYLLDMTGRVVRTWESESSGASSAYLLENGHLLRLARLSSQAFGDGPGAAGHIQEFSWDGELVWDFKLATAKLLSHHDICRMPNGNTLLIVWEKKSAQEAIAAGRRAETVPGNMLPEAVFEVKPTGKTTGEVVWEWHVWDHLIQDHDPTKANYGEVGAHPELVDLNFGDGVLASIVAKKDELDKLRAIGYVGTTSPGAKPAPVRADWLHLNAVAYNADFDQILINSPEFDEFWIIDHGTTTAEAANHRGGRSGKGGDLLYRWGNPRAYRHGGVKDQKLFYQHNAHWIPKGYPGEGHILVFNNGRRRPGGAHSSVDEIVLPVDAEGRYAYSPGNAYGPEKPVWSYAAPKKPDFYGEFISGANRLPNGNTFICTGPSGTIFEVTPEKEIVWKYVNPAKPSAPPASPSRAVELMPTSLRETVKVTAEQDKQLDELSRQTEEQAQSFLTDEQKKKLREPAPAAPGMPSFAGGPPQAVVVLAPPLRQRLKLGEEQKKKADSLQLETVAKVEKLLTAEQRKELQAARDSFVNAWAGGPPAVPTSPGKPTAVARPAPGPGGGGPPMLGNAVFRSYRYAANYPAFTGKELTPGKTVEETK
jgi:hypothetical protein